MKAKDKIEYWQFSKFTYGYDLKYKFIENQIKYLFTDIKREQIITVLVYF